jgi:hypothetical protein
MIIKSPLTDHQNFAALNIEDPIIGVPVVHYTELSVGIGSFQILLTLFINRICPYLG